MTKKPIRNSEIFHANSEKSKRFQHKSEKSSYSFSTLMHLSHNCSFNNILTEANKDGLILERITEVGSTGALGHRQRSVELIWESY
jgi:hypothetical protein